MTAHPAARAWLAVAAVMLLLLAGSVSMVQDQWRRDGAQAEASAQRELRLLTSLVGNDLRLGDYQHIASLLNEWGQGNPEITALNLLAANGFSISEYRRAAPALQSLTLDTPIEYSYSGRAKLVLSKDTSFLVENRTALLVKLGLALTLIAVMLVILTRLLLLYRAEGARLTAQGEELDRSNAALESEFAQRRELEEERDRLIAVMESSPDFISIADLNGNLLYLNQGGRNMIGMGPRPVDELHIPDMHPQWATDRVVAEGIPAALSDGIWVGENALLHRDGSEVPVSQVIMTHLDAQGKLMYLSTVMRDISGRKRAEQALRNLNEELEDRVRDRTVALAAAKEEAERANEAKSEFLSRMSHELRTPLNAILGFGQLVLRQAHEPEEADNAQEIVRAGQHLLDLINEVLDLARIESGKFTVSKEPMPLMPLIVDCLNLIRPQAEARGIRILDTGPDASLQAVADRTRLKQVLLNLLSNAVKYNRPEGTISIACLAQGETVQIRISDTGPGLTEEQQARLFVAFERLNADQSVIEGTGIGLALSKRLMELMEGEIGVDSTPGSGSTFWVRLPIAAGLAQVPAPEDPPVEAATPHHAGQRQWEVLYIEDNPANLRLVERVLGHQQNLRLITASAPGAGLELARSHRPDLILLDINLPDMDGYAVMQCLRENATTRHIPVVAISANAMPADLARGKAAGFVDYLTKPLDIDKFTSIIYSILERGNSNGARRDE